LEQTIDRRTHRRRHILNRFLRNGTPRWTGLWLVPLAVLVIPAEMVEAQLPPLPVEVEEWAAFYETVLDASVGMWIRDADGLSPGVVALFPRPHGPEIKGPDDPRMAPHMGLMAVARKWSLPPESRDERHSFVSLGPPRAWKGEAWIITVIVSRPPHRKPGLTEVLVTRGPDGAWRASPKL
jgi:hypothetical protein